MLLMVNVHYTRISDMVVPDHLVISPSVPIRAYRDGFGNWCNRIVLPAGRTRLSAGHSRHPNRLAPSATPGSPYLC
jgi:hypothetical protein